MDPGPPWVEAAAVGSVASLADSSAEVIDGSTLSFLLQRALEVKRKEEEEAVEAAELEEKLAAAEERLLAVLRRDREERTRVSRHEEEEEEEDEVDTLAPVWFLVPLLFMTSLTILSSVLWVVSLAPCIWQSLVLFGSCLRSTVRGSFWEMTSRYVVFSASWFDSGYIFMPVYGRCGYCFRLQRNAWSSVVHAMRQLRSMFCLVVDAPVVQVVFFDRCCARQMPMVQTLQKFVEVPQLQFLHGFGRRFHWSMAAMRGVLAFLGPIFALRPSGR